MAVENPSAGGPVLMTNGEIRSTARAKLAGKWGRAVLAFVIVTVISGIAGGVVSFFGEAEPGRVPPALVVIVNVLVVLIELPLQYGFQTFFLKLVRDQNPSIERLFDGFQIFWKAVAVQLVRNLLPLLWALVFFLPGLGLMWLLMYLSPSFLISYLQNPVAYWTILLGVTAAIAVVVSFRYALAVYILHDNPDSRTMQVIRLSSKMMRGRRWKLFMLYLSFIGWAILCLLTLGIGYLFLVPYIEASVAVFYEDLKRFEAAFAAAEAQA